MAVISALRRWKNGEVFNARDYVYERDLIISEVNRLSTLLNPSATASMDLNVNKLTANEIVLQGGDLNEYIRGNAVYTETPENQQSGDLWFD